MKYRALVDMSVPVNAEEDARVRKLTADGITEIPDRKLTSIAAGDVPEYIPEGSIPWLLEQGYIEVVPDESMTKVELEEMAAEKGVDVSGARTKADLIERIEGAS